MFSISLKFSQRAFLGFQASRGLKIAVLGGTNQVGNVLSLMLKLSPWFDEIAIHDTVSPKGLAMELNFIDTPNLVSAHEGLSGLRSALKDSDIVMITSGLEEKSIMKNEQENFAQNCKIIYDLSRSCAMYCPQAFIAICTNPLNTTLPIACEVFKQTNGDVDPTKIFGVMTLIAIRSSALVAEVIQVPPEKVTVPIIGGSSPLTTVPILSQATPNAALTTEEVVKITRALKNASEDLLKVKKNQGSISLSLAFAAKRFAESLARALNGEENVMECVYMMSNVIPDLSYFASPALLGPSGVRRNLGIPDMSSYECTLLENAIPHLKRDIELGESFTANLHQNKIRF